MSRSQRSWRVDRRTVVRTGAALAAVQFAAPFIIKARGETPVRIGMVDPLTGVYAAIAQGVYKRSLDGNASDPDRARQYGKAAPTMARLAMEAIETGV